MLEGLDEIDWSRLTHAYGHADDVPGSIRELTSDDSETRKKAFNDLHATICHQGSRYRASAPAVPFLFELLEQPAAQDKVRFIQLLVGLAIGYPEWHVPLGFNPTTAFVEIETLGSPQDLDHIRDAEPDEEEDDELPRQALWQKDTYEAVLKRIGTFQELTRDADAEVRKQAVKALAWFSEAALDSQRFVRGFIHSNSEPNEIANAILCLGILDRYLADASEIPWFAARLSPAYPIAVRLNAAISLAVMLNNSAPAECLDLLLDAIQHPKRTDAEGISWPGSGPWRTRAPQLCWFSRHRRSRFSRLCAEPRNRYPNPWRGPRCSWHS